MSKVRTFGDNTWKIMTRLQSRQVRLFSPKLLAFGLNYLQKNQANAFKQMFPRENKNGDAS